MLNFLSGLRIRLQIKWTVASQFSEGNIFFNLSNETFRIQIWHMQLHLSKMLYGISLWRGNTQTLNLLSLVSVKRNNCVSMIARSERSGEMNDVFKLWYETIHKPD